MKKRTMGWIAIATLVAVTGSAWAEETTPVVRHRQKNQQKRIANGVASGELTPRETVKLEKEQQAVQHEKKEAKADGVVTPGERKEIRQDQNKASRDIYRKKHNARKTN